MMLHKSTLEMCTKNYLASLINPVMKKFPGYVFFLMQKTDFTDDALRKYIQQGVVSVKSVARFWDLLVATLKAVPHA